MGVLIVVWDGAGVWIDWNACMGKASKNSWARKKGVLSDSMRMMGGRSELDMNLYIYSQIWSLEGVERGNIFTIREELDMLCPNDRNTQVYTRALIPNLNLLQRRISTEQFPLNLS